GLPLRGRPCEQGVGTGAEGVGARRALGRQRAPRVPRPDPGPRPPPSPSRPRRIHPALQPASAPPRTRPAATAPHAAADRRATDRRGDRPPARPPPRPARRTDPRFIPPGAQAWSRLTSLSSRVRVPRKSETRSEPFGWYPAAA